MKQATLQDVATLASVSTGTVSKYINGAQISPKNEKRIKNAIEALHYTPNPLARKFAIGKSFDILLLLIVEQPIAPSSWLHELSIIQGINDALVDCPYSLKIEIASLTNVEANIARVESFARSRYIDAVILLSPWEINPDMITILDYHSLPYVTIGHIKNRPYGSAIDFDNLNPVQEIVETLFDKGHRHFAMISGFKDQVHARVREEGFRLALQRLRLPVEEGFVRYGDYSLNSGYSIANQLLELDNPPTAFICANDYVASGAIRAILAKGFTIPKDIAVSGFDDTVVSEATNPTITTVRMPGYKLGQIATQELLKKLHDPTYEIENQRISCQVIWKQSTASETSNANTAQSAGRLIVDV